MQNRTESSRLINDLEIEMCYQLTDRFFIGKPNEPENLQDDNLYIKIDLPLFDRKVKQIARSSEVTGYEGQLSDYYRNILNTARKYERSYLHVHHYFWLRLWLWQTEKDAYISFPWYDTLDEIRHFFKAFKTNRIGQIFHDSEQAWELKVVADNDYYYLKQTDPERDQLIIENLKIEKKRLEIMIRNLENRMDDQNKRLTELLGIDLWSNREYLYKDLN